MKAIRYMLPLLLGTALLCSCGKNSPNKNNPVVYELAAADFDVTLLDYERGYYRDSSYVFEGVWKEGAFRFGLQKKDPMTPNILPDGRNQIEFRISSLSPDFEGVNASSSTQAINIIQDGHDHTVYHLEWVGEGESTITFWNGSGAGRKETTFTATSKKEIPLKGIKLRFGNLVTDLNHKVLSDPITKEAPRLLVSDPVTYYTTWQKESDSRQGEISYTMYASSYNENWNRMTPVELIPDPLNATEEPYYFGALYWSNKGNGNIYDNKERLEKENIKNYPSFRWLKGYSQTFAESESELDNLLKIYPSDLRERTMVLYYSYEKNGTLLDATLRITISKTFVYDYTRKENAFFTTGDWNCLK